MPGAARVFRQAEKAAAKLRRKTGPSSASIEELDGEKPDGSNPLDAMLEEYAAISRQVARDAAASGGAK